MEVREEGKGKGKRREGEKKREKERGKVLQVTRQHFESAAAH